MVNVTKFLCGEELFFCCLERLRGNHYRIINALNLLLWSFIALILYFCSNQISSFNFSNLQCKINSALDTSEACTYSSISYRISLMLAIYNMFILYVNLVPLAIFKYINNGLWFVKILFQAIILLIFLSFLSNEIVQVYSMVSFYFGIGVICAASLILSYQLFDFGEYSINIMHDMNNNDRNLSNSFIIGFLILSSCCFLGSTAYALYNLISQSSLNIHAILILIGNFLLFALNGTNFIIRRCTRKKIRKQI